jgi:hypothetical protein
MYSFFTVSFHFDAQVFISNIKISLLQASVPNDQYLFKIIALEVNTILLAVM